MQGMVAGSILLLTFLTSTPNALASSSPTPSTPKTTQAPTPKKSNPYSIYKVMPGDSLYSISLKFYGSQKYWMAIWNDNDSMLDPKGLKPNQKLKLRVKNKIKVEDLKPKLAEIYDELTTTPTPTPQVLAATISSAPTSFDDIYKQAGSKYGVPWEILYGIHLTETGLRDGAIPSGYGTGAQGPMQFMPDTWEHYGVDGSGDGTADINNAIDAIYSAANYLASHGGVIPGLKAYGGDMQGILNAAKSRGFNL